MSVQALSAVLESSEARLGARLVLIAIANHANEVGKHAFPNVETIGREARLSVRQVIRCVQELEELGELLVERTTNKPNIYKINLPVLEGDNMAREEVTSISSSLTTKNLSTYGSRDISGPDLSPGDNLSPLVKDRCGHCQTALHEDGYCANCGLIWRDGRSNAVQPS